MFIETGSMRAAEIHPGRPAPRLLHDRVVRLSAAAIVVWLALYALVTGLAAPGTLASKLLVNVAYDVPLVAAIALSALAARRGSGRMRWFWASIVVAAAFTLAGDLAWTWQELVQGREMPYPSVADGLYLASYPPMIAAVLLGFGDRAGIRSGRALLDASLLAAALGYVGVTLLIEPQLAEGFSLSAAVASAYPLLDMIVLVLLGSLVFAARRDVPPSAVIVAAALAVCAFTDAGYTWLATHGEYVTGRWLDLGWQAYMALVALAAVVALRGSERSGRPRLLARDPGLAPVLLGALVTVAVIAVEGAHGGFRPVAAVLLVYVVGGVIVRLLITARENGRIARELERALAEQRRLTVTDQLTGLRNRRFFEESLTLEVERSLRSQRSVGLLVIDVDRLSNVNDEHGHAAGDAVLVQAATRIARCVRSTDVVARQGDEFVVLLHEGDSRLVERLGERCRRAVSERPFATPGGTRVQVSASVGGAALPDDAGDAAALLRAAERALHGAKAAGRDRVSVGADPHGPDLNLLLEAGGALVFFDGLADERDGAQHDDDHGREVSRLTGLVAEELGLTPERRNEVVLAARFHDVGKVRVPDAVLAKPGPLDADEWALVREHPAHGAELISLVPDLVHLAPVVRHHHERWDGSGYPDGLSGEEIPLGSRIISACDAWRAMRSDRAYRAALSEEEASIELRACSGSQFDPRVVDALLRVIERDRAARAVNAAG
jgi:two-component system cell cycle response regulator